MAQKRQREYYHSSLAKRIGTDTLSLVEAQFGVYEGSRKIGTKWARGSEVNRNERLRSVLRSKLNRLARKTKGYSKSVEMLGGSLALLWFKAGWI